jgi:hypothetical protein
VTTDHGRGYIGRRSHHHPPPVASSRSLRGTAATFGASTPTTTPQPSWRTMPRSRHTAPRPRNNTWTSVRHPGSPPGESSGCRLNAAACSSAASTAHPQLPERCRRDLPFGRWPPRASGQALRHYILQAARLDEQITHWTRLLAERRLPWDC